MGFTWRRGWQERIAYSHSDVAKSCWLRGILLLSWLGLLSACAVDTPSLEAGATPDSAKIAPALQVALQGLDQGKTTGRPHRWVQDTQGRIQVYAYVSHATGGILATLQQAGMTHIVNVPELNVVEGWVAPSRIPALTRLPWVTRITLPRYARSR